MRAFALGAALLAGCYRPAPQAGGPCSANGTCPDPLACIDGTCQSSDTPPADAAIDACPDVSCAGNDLAACGSRLTCSLGCADAAGTTPAHCRTMVPSNGLDPAMLTGATADVSGIDLDFDTDTGEVTFNSGMPLRAPGTGVNAGIGFQVVDKMGVFTARSWTVSAFVTNSGDDWDASGSNALVLFAATTIEVLGAIDVGGSGSGGGPSGFSGGSSGSSGPFCRGKAGLWQMTGYGEGGGGAGGRVAGGNGAVSNTTTFGTGGPSCSTFPTTIPLAGGNGGGAAGVETAPNPDIVHGGSGGGGGGALALVAMESIRITGYVCAPGAGGLTSATGDGGGGGGGGGAVLLESPVVDLMPGGAITANGGGGAAPTMANGSRGHEDDASGAAGGVFMTGAGGRGGTGAAPTSGTNFTDATTARGGGGGGAGGRTEIKARARSTTGAIVSPGAALTDIVTK